MNIPITQYPNILKILKPTFYEKYMPTANIAGRINLAPVCNLGTRCKRCRCPRQSGLLA
jgi:hypothetical protein